MHIAVQKDNNTENSVQYPQPQVDATPLSARIHFTVTANAIHISHSEMLRVLERACIRAGVPLLYSRGFNPHPRISLPLPKSVGVESEDELLCIRLQPDAFTENQEHTDQVVFDSTRLENALARRLPNGCRVISVDFVRSAVPPQPSSVTYAIHVKPEYADRKIEMKILSLLESENIPVQRKTGPMGRRTKTLNVRGFLGSIELKENVIVIECSISQAGSIRVDEMLGLLGLDNTMLAEPVKRTNVRWLDE